MKKVILSGFMTLVVLSSFAHADDGFEIQNRKVYGNCQVFESVDLFTDERRYYFQCFKREERTIFGRKVRRITARVGVNSYRKEGKDYLQPQIDLSTVNFRDTIAVKIRIDKGPIYQGDWSWNRKEDVAFIGGAQGHNLSVWLVEQLSQGKSILIQVRDKRKQIELNGVRQARQDFRQRIRSLQWAGNQNL